MSNFYRRRPYGSPFNAEAFAELRERTQNKVLFESTPGLKFNYFQDLFNTENFKADNIDCFGNYIGGSDEGSLY